MVICVLGVSSVLGVMYLCVRGISSACTRLVSGHVSMC